MSAQPAPIHEDRVTVTDTAIYISTFTDTDADVIRVVKDADDQIDAVHNCLRIGATALRVANTAVDVDLVQRSFDDLADRLDVQVNGAVDQIRTATEGLLDGDTGSLQLALTRFHGSIEELLGETFDPDSKKSVVSTIESQVETIVRSAVEGVREIVEPEGDQSPLARLKGEILVGVKGEIDGVVREIRDVSERFGIAAAVAVEHERTAAKGFDFEDVVDACVAEISAVHGDAHEHVGKETGVTGSQVGDEVVTLDREDTRGQAGRFVLEVKKRKLGMRKIQDELDEAMRNRDALAAIAVFDSQANAPTTVPFHYIDDKAIVVLDDSGTDTAALRLAYMWARWTVRRKLTSDAGDAIDHERVRSLIEQARRSIGRVTTIRKCHSSATKAIEEAKSETSQLADEVRDVLSDLEAELSHSVEVDR
ncbi:MAG: hypothetical protein M3Q30_00940 [Actinomycetota bacterium]|nr:hypothetical protein [Actinomycetota bacterium]